MKTIAETQLGRHALPATTVPGSRWQKCSNTPPAFRIFRLYNGENWSITLGRPPRQCSNRRPSPEPVTKERKTYVKDNRMQP